MTLRESVRYHHSMRGKHTRWACPSSSVLASKPHAALPVRACFLGAALIVAAATAPLASSQEGREAAPAFGPVAQSAQSAASQATRAARALLDPPVLSLVASASREVPNDRLVVVLFAEREGGDSATAQAAVQALLGPALESLRRADPPLEFESGSWRAWPVNVDGRIRNWRARASVRIEGAPSEAYASLVAQLSGTLAIESLRHELSRSARERAEGELLAQAATRFQDKAQAAARALGFRDATIRAVSLNQAQSGSPVPMARAGLSASAMAGGTPIPTAEGTTTVMVSLEGSVWLGR